MNNDSGALTAQGAVFLKQYGAERSGTNYLKRLIELNFPNAVVFGSVLGWKHGLYETRNGPDAECTSHAQWLESCSMGNAVYSVDGHRLPFTTAELQESIPQLHYVVSTRPLASWVHGFKQFRARQRAWSSQEVESWSRRWLSAHEKWAVLLETHGGIVVEFEALIRDISPVLEGLQSRFRLTRRHPHFVNEPRIVKASTDSGLLFSKEHFDPKPHQNHEYKSVIPVEIHRIIESFEEEAESVLTRLRAASCEGSREFHPKRECENE